MFEVTGVSSSHPRQEGVEVTDTRRKSKGPGDAKNYGAFEVMIADHVATVTLRGTGRGNLLGRTAWIELGQVFQALDGDVTVRAAVLRGAEDSFSVGLDLRWYVHHLRHAMRSSDGLAAARAALLEENRLMQKAVGTLATCRKPVVAAIHGACIGGGLDIATACDFRLASADAIFSVREVKLGIVADLGVLQRLPSIVGEGHARELAYTGSDIDPDDALRMGLVNRVYDTPMALFDAANAVAVDIAANPPRAVAGTKEILDEMRDNRIQGSLAQAAMWNAAFLPSQDFDEAVAALVDGRRPTFVGR